MTKTSAERRRRTTKENFIFVEKIQVKPTNGSAVVAFMHPRVQWSPSAVENTGCSNTLTVQSVPFGTVNATLDRRSCPTAHAYDNACAETENDYARALGQARVGHS